MSSSGADGLNRAQRTAVTTMSGPLLVLAGAGTGKTRVITFRIAELIRDGTVPSRILAVTFTNKAAKEMRHRAQTLLGKKKKRKQKGPEISTFHSLCVRILRRNAKLLGYPENFTIYDRGDQESIARGALRDIRVGAESLRPGDLINIISGWKGASIGPEDATEAAKDDRELLAAQAFARYQTSLRTSGAMDFDDLLNLAEKLLLEHPEARFAEASRFDHLLIDEYQDTNGLQYRIVKALAERHRNICVVGDDDQSIYGWRGAEVEHILGFKDQWPDAKVVRLEENYRSTGWILHLANTLIAHNTVRHDKVLKPARSNGDPPRFVPYEDENHEAESVVGEIFRKINRTDDERVFASEIAILFRTNEQPRAFEQEMRRAGVPYRLVGGQSFYDRKEIKDLLCYLRIVANPIDEVSLLRIINTPPRGIGPGSVQTLVDDAVAAGEPLWNVLPTALEHPDLSNVASRAVEDFRQVIDEFRSRMADEPVSQLVIELIDRVDYKAELQRQYKDPGEQETRWNAVQELVNAAATYEEREEEPSLIGFLEESTISDRDDNDDDDKQEHAVTLMTLHSAKGLEFPEVYLVGMEEGLLPHKRSLMEDANTIPEERRLAYVGVTRAQTKLTLSFCKGRMKWGKLKPQIPSRFLMEMRGETEKAKALAEQAVEQFTRDQARASALEEEKAGKKKKGRKKRPTEKKPEKTAAARTPGKKSPRAEAGREKKSSEKARVTRAPAAEPEAPTSPAKSAKSGPTPVPSPPMEDKGSVGPGASVMPADPVVEAEPVQPAPTRPTTDSPLDSGGTPTTNPAESAVEQQPRSPAGAAEGVHATTPSRLTEIESQGIDEPKAPIADSTAGTSTPSLVSAESERTEQQTAQLALEPSIPLAPEEAGKEPSSSGPTPTRGDIDGALQVRESEGESVSSGVTAAKAPAEVSPAEAPTDLGGMDPREADNAVEPEPPKMAPALSTTSDSGLSSPDETRVAGASPPADRPSSRREGGVDLPASLERTMAPTAALSKEEAKDARAREAMSTKPRSAPRKTRPSPRGPASAVPRERVPEAASKPPEPRPDPGSAPYAEKQSAAPEPASEEFQLTPPSSRPNRPRRKRAAPTSEQQSTDAKVNQPAGSERYEQVDLFGDG